MSEKYDSTGDTVHHITRVQSLLNCFVFILNQQSRLHDVSKLVPPEKEIFDEFTPKLSGTTYGSKEYKDNFAEMSVATKHHNEVNRHHPEFHGNDLGKMDLIDIVEMLLDWKAASERHKDGDVFRSIEQQQEKLGYDDTFKNILINTVNRVTSLDDTEGGRV